MAAEFETDSHLEIAHVLFVDIVGYSSLLTNEQRELLRKLNNIVRATKEFRTADSSGKLLRLPTGDGMALAFLSSPDAPVRCALEIAQALKDGRKLPLRMGIHSGPVDPSISGREVWSTLSALTPNKEKKIEPRRSLCSKQPLRATRSSFSPTVFSPK